MSVPIVVIGAGGFGRETLDVIEAINHVTPDRFLVHGVVDDAPSARARALLAARGIRWLGTIEEWLAGDDDSSYVVGIGDPHARERVATRMQAEGHEEATLIHPNATIGSVGSIAPGSIVCSGVQISTNVILGRHSHVNPAVTIGHDSSLADFVSVNPGAIVSGDVRIERLSLIGAGAVVLQGLSVGSGVTVGASACVTRNVPAGVTAKGVPARWN